jgi:diacylglycerol diphosphate phosphatase/phosphatidate phosphatase
VKWGRSDGQQQHQAHDLIFGMLVGLVLGMLAYRSAYTAVFDFRYNHIPLPPFAIKTQFSRSETGCREMYAALEEDQAAEDDELVFWSGWKQSISETEGKEKEIAWLQSFKSLRATGRELDSKAKPRVRNCTEVQMLLRAQGDK